MTCRSGEPEPSLRRFQATFRSGAEAHGSRASARCRAAGCSSRHFGAFLRPCQDQAEPLKIYRCVQCFTQILISENLFKCYPTLPKLGSFAFFAYKGTHSATHDCSRTDEDDGCALLRIEWLTSADFTCSEKMFRCPEEPLPAPTEIARPANSSSPSLSTKGAIRCTSASGPVGGVAADDCEPLSPNLAQGVSLAIRDAPKLTLTSRPLNRPKRHNPSKVYGFRYRSKKHKSLPHVVKFSGGRSSGMMLFSLLENGLLDRERGDVIVFNNTSAEHPNTYRYVQDCVRASRAYGIPFFHIEFQTYEDARQGEWIRLPTYRLVNNQPKSDANPDGYHWRGEAFEELLSWTGYVPNQFNRICTHHLKLDVTRNFLKDWLASKPVISRLGHFGDSSRIDPDASYRRHRRNQGGVPKDIFVRKREFLWSRPHFRPEQRYEDFCPNWRPFENDSLAGKRFGEKAWFGKHGVEYVAFIGLRGDEQHRVHRVELRGESADGYEGEHIYMPLNDLAVTKSDVNEFWKRQPWNLQELANGGVSNCVFCFLKGTSNLDAVYTDLRNAESDEEQGFGLLRNSPCDLQWWVNMESKYGRDLRAENRNCRSNVSKVGFFGNSAFNYNSIRQGKGSEAQFEAMLPCDCTE